MERYLNQVRSRPLFLYLHYRDVHEPYAPPPPFDRGCVAGDSPEVIEELARRRIILKGEEDVYRCFYDGEIRYTDHYLSKMFDLLHKNGITRENTIWIITADHGEEFYEEHPRDLGYHSHGRTLYQEQIRVPLILGVPKLQNRVVEQQVGLVDVAPTILDLLQINWKKYHQFQGRSLMNLLKTGSGLPSLILSGGNRKRGVLIRNGWKYYRYEKECKLKRSECFVRPDKTDFLYGEELYRIESDPKETENLVAKEPKLAAEMQKQLTSFLNSVSFQEAATTRDLDEQTKEELKALGYIN
jgi:arylsulfatase A-like enzyme